MMTGDAIGLVLLPIVEKSAACDRPKSNSEVKTGKELKPDCDFWLLIYSEGYRRRGQRLGKVQATRV